MLLKLWKAIMVEMTRYQVFTKMRWPLSAVYEIASTLTRLVPYE